VDNDGHMDVLAAAMGDSAIWWYQNDGAGAFVKYLISDEVPAARSVAYGDFNGDGHLDAVSGSSEVDQGNTDDGMVAWYESDGASPPQFTKHVISDDVPGQRSIVVADLDGDGDLDVGGCSRLDGTVAFYENTGGKKGYGGTYGGGSYGGGSYGGDTEFVKHVASNETLSAFGIAACDVDLDGIDDMISASPQLHEIAWYKLEDDGSFTKHVIYEGANGAFRLACGDVDGDGDYDIFSADNQGGTVGFYENLCTSPDESSSSWKKNTVTCGEEVPDFEVHVVTSILDSPRSVALGDLDGDGFLDLLSASVDDDTVAWYQNKC